MTKSQTGEVLGARKRPGLRPELEARSRRLAPRFHPDREAEAWAALLETLC